MIGNAHLDPVWLWHWPAGLDEALATCRTMCDLLDEYPDLFITRGEAWIHHQIQKLEPKLFARIARHIKSGRWQIVNGWWIQPDCNLPTEKSFLKQAEIGKQYFRKSLGVNATVGYNVDSFGHCAMLPKFLRESGMDSYVFRRPAQHERKLPADLFTWKAKGGSVTAFRLSPSYASESLKELEYNLTDVIKSANAKAGHTMCFYGVGDHGGGPTREQIEWIREHIDYRPGVQLRLSHPKAFFDAVRKSGAKLPVVTGELQRHAIGCYSVVHQIKQETRKAENLLIQAENLVGKYAPGAPETKLKLNAAWERVLFNQFHDIMGGSSLESAYEHSSDELGLAKTTGREIIVDITRRIIAKIRPSRHQQIVLTNASENPFKGYIEFEPWLPLNAAKSPLKLIGGGNKEIPYQRLLPEAAVSFFVRRILFPAQIPALGHKIMQIRYEEPVRIKPMLKVNGQGISNRKVSIRLCKTGIKEIGFGGGKSVIRGNGIRLAVFTDKSDTWSHGMTGYDGKLTGVFKAAKPWAITEKGPLQIGMANTFNLKGSRVLWETYLRAGEPAIRFRLKVQWNGKHQILKLLIPCGFKPIERIDGCPGGEVTRPTDGLEYPMHNYALLKGKQMSLAVISADAYGLDILPDNTIRITLLRSPYYAHHAPFEPPKINSYPVTDQGMHEYEFSILPMRRLDTELIRAGINMQAKPVWTGETTRGMKPV